MPTHVRSLAAALVAITLAVTLPQFPDGAGASPAGPASLAVPLCGVADPAAVVQPSTPVPTGAVRNGPGGFAVSSFTVANNELYTVDGGAQTVRRFTLDGQPLGTVQVGFRLSAPTLAVDSAGSMYVGQYPASLVKLSPTGSVVWSRTVGEEISGVYAFPGSAGFRVGVVSRGVVGSTLLDTAGTRVGAAAVTGIAFSPAPDGGVVATDGAYVRRYDAVGSQVGIFGDARTANDPSPTGGPFHFYQQGGAVVAPDGTVYVADATRGIEAASPEGYWKGLIGEDTLGYLTERSSLAIAGDRLYFAAGGRFNANQRIASISLTDAAALRSAPREPNPVLGFGAGVATGVVGNYFAPGQTPRLEARFDPWWATRAAELRLAYAVRDHRQVLSGVAVTPTTLALPTTAAALSAVGLSLPAARPGPYEVDVRLLAADGSVVGATCMTYSVGGPGQRLDFAALPPGADYGGPAPARGVALADVLGTGNFRGSLDWSVLLPDPSGTINFAPYDAAFADAAREAAARGVAFHVQLGAGAPAENALVQNGTWGRRVREVVEHFKSTVRTWEVWNEPNITFGPPESYVAQVLRPASEAIRAADPGARVIGGSVVGIDVGYYDAIGRAGGYALMDIVAIHPYTGHNRSWEEQGTPAAVGRLKAVLAAHQAGAKPIWITESAWWADGPGNYLAQAAKVARGLIWARALGIERWNYFMMEGGYGDYGFSYSLIESGAQVDDYVKPGALAAMSASAQMAGRPFAGWVDSAIPHTWAARFGPRAGGSDAVVVAWSDDFTVPARLSLDVSGLVGVTDVFGATTSASLIAGQSLDVELSGLPVYLTVPASAGVRLVAVEAFGANLAAAGAGARASASSATTANPAAAAIDGASDALDRGDLVGLPAWSSAPGDSSPSLTVTLPRPVALNRVLVSTHSLGSIITGLRSYDVAVQENGTWVTVGQVRDQFFTRQRLVTFPTRTATAIRVSVASVNFGGLAGGAKPWFWPTDSASLGDPASPWHGPAVIYEVEAYAGAAPASTTSTTTVVATATPTTTTQTTTTTTTTPTDAPPTALAAPTSLGPGGVSSNQVNLGWTAVAGATTYELQRSPDGTNYVSLGITSQANWADVGLSPGTTYHYRVRALADSIASSYSVPAEITTLPDAPPIVPSNLVVTATSASQIALSWTASARATAYVVERSIDAASWQRVATVVGSIYGDSSLARNRTYYYRVVATNASGASAPSAIASARTKRR